MTMKYSRKIVAGVLLAACAGWWLWTSPSSPIAPPKKPDRPVLNAILNVGRMAARLGLWIALCGDRPSSNQMVVHAKIGDDGAPAIDNGACW